MYNTSLWTNSFDSHYHLRTIYKCGISMFKTWINNRRFI